MITQVFSVHVEMDGNLGRVLKLSPDPCDAGDTQGGFDLKILVRNPLTLELEQHMLIQGEIEPTTGLPLVTAFKTRGDRARLQAGWAPSISVPGEPRTI